MADIFEHKRKSLIIPGEIYFWTATIHKWFHLLEKDTYKQVIIDSLQHLSDAGKIDVFGFVIMPNHIHLIWRINGPNGKETSQGSFLKHTAHKFKELLMHEGGSHLLPYRVNAANKKHEFWQRDSLAVHVYSEQVGFQKLTYIHNNPLAKHWHLVTDPIDYLYSSARFYDTGSSNYPFLRDLRIELQGREDGF